jgi:serine/threonine-protein kinase RIM15
MSDGVNNGLLAPPAVNHLRSTAGLMERTLSEDIREEREDLRQAAEETLNVIMDLSLQGVIRWVSPSWTHVVGTSMEEVQGKPIADLLLDDDKDIFANAHENMKKDDSRSQIVRFTLALGPASKLAPPKKVELFDDGVEGFLEDHDDEPPVITLEAQGIMVHDRSSDDSESHVSSNVFICFGTFGS